MKRIFALILVFLLTASMVFAGGCKGKVAKNYADPEVEDVNTDDSTSPPAENIVPHMETNVQQPVLAPVMSGNESVQAPETTNGNPVMLTPIPWENVPATPVPTAPPVAPTPVPTTPPVVPTPAPTSPPPTPIPTATIGEGMTSVGNSSIVYVSDGGNQGIDVNIGGDTGNSSGASPTSPPSAPSGNNNSWPVFTGTGDPYEFSSTTLGGASVNSKDLFAAASLTMVNVWTTYCTPCIGEMPSLMKLHESYADMGFQVVGIVCDVRDNSNELADQARDIVVKTGAMYKNVIYSDSMKNGILKGVSTVPYTLFLDSEGRLLCEPVRGAKSYELWSQKINELFASVGVTPLAATQATPSPTPDYECFGSY